MSEQGPHHRGLMCLTSLTIFYITLFSYIYFLARNYEIYNFISEFLISFQVSQKKCYNYNIHYLMEVK